MESFGIGTLGTALGCSAAAVAVGALLLAANKLGIFYQLFHKVGCPNQTRTFIHELSSAPLFKHSAMSVNRHNNEPCSPRGNHLRTGNLGSLHARAVAHAL